MEKTRMTIEAPIMFRDERSPQLTCFIVGYWVRINDISVSISINEMTELYSLNADIKESPDYQQCLNNVNDNPQFRFLKNSNELHLDSTFRETPYRRIIIETIIRFLNLDDCMITDNERYWSNIVLFDIDPKDQFDLFWKVYVESFNEYTRQVIHNITPSNVVDLVISGRKDLVIHYDILNKCFTVDVN